MTNREVFAKCVKLWQRVIDVRDHPRYLELKEKWDEYALGNSGPMTESEWTEFLSFQDLEMKAVKAYEEFMEAKAK